MKVFYGRVSFEIFVCDCVVLNSNIYVREWISYLFSGLFKFRKVYMILQESYFHCINLYTDMIISYVWLFGCYVLWQELDSTD